MMARVLFGALAGGAAGWAHVMSLWGCLALARAGRPLEFVASQALRLAGVALTLALVARLGAPALAAASLALILARQLAIARQRSRT